MLNGKDQHDIKAQPPTLVTLSGIFIPDKEPQLEKAKSPILVTFSGITTFDKELHPQYLEVIDYQLFAVNTVEKWIGSYLWIYGK